jgi:WD40 repeat protein
VATGGSDGKICIWDTTSKKRIFKTSFNTSISALAFNQSGNKLAIASSYIQDGGEHLHDGLHKIIIKDISDSLVRNKIIN